MQNLGQISGAPQMTDTLDGWVQNITLQVRSQVVDDGLVSYTTRDYSFKGTIQPLSPRAIMLKPEYQRAFSWLQIHIYSNHVLLDVNDEIIFSGKKYKVMGQYDYRLNGFMEYHACYEYQPT